MVVFAMGFSKYRLPIQPDVETLIQHTNSYPVTSGAVTLLFTPAVLVMVVEVAEVVIVLLVLSAMQPKMLYRLLMPPPPHE